jgi:hypothetical protein
MYSYDTHFYNKLLTKCKKIIALIKNIIQL